MRTIKYLIISLLISALSPDLVFSQGTSITADPGNMVKYRNNNGITYSVKVTGTDQGSVWGGADGIYTDDSRLGKAAVHAGLLRVGQDGIVKVTILPGQPKYMGSTNNGVTTTNYGGYSGSYKFEGSATGVTSIVSGIITDPGNMTSYRSNVGKTYSVKVTGTDQGSAWGGADGIYTDDSRLGKAAVHAGLLRVGEEGVLKVTIVQGQPKYTGSTRNGITTNNYGAYSGSYRFEGGSTTVPATVITTGAITDPGNMTNYRNSKGQTYSVKVTGTDQGSAWGGADGIYTDDSRLGKAAVHAGLLRVGEEGVLKVTIVQGQPKYTGSTRNGITTNNYGAYSGSYRFEGGSTTVPATVITTGAITDPGNMTSYRNSKGQTYSVKVTGTDQGSAWGGADGIYTDDSRLGKAAVHAGLLRVGEEGVLKVTIVQGQPKYTGSTRNGITTNNYGAYSGSYRFEGGSTTVPATVITTGAITDPGNMTSYRNSKGQTYSVKVTGTDQGSAWGGADGIYTDDSRLGKAAVHAGLLRVGEEGVLKVTIVQGQPKYTGSTRNGITTNNYGAYSGSYRFEGGSTTVPATVITTGAITDPGNMTSYRNSKGQTYSVKVTGTDQGSAWGGADGIYTDDSRLAKAAVHAGLLKVGETGVVRVTIVQGQSGYTGSTRFGVSTSNYGAYSGSYKFEGVSGTTITTAEINTDPGNLTSLRNNNGRTYTVRVTGTDQGSVWGGATGIYTDDSRLGKAAVHAGLLKVGQEGIVKVTILGAQTSFGGSTRNGITTTNYGAYGGSFKFEW